MAESVTIPKINEKLKSLPDDKLAVVFDFVSYLAERDVNDIFLGSESEPIECMYASEQVLARDWNLPEEDIGELHSRRSVMKLCECGCGSQTKGGVFCPGHDRRLEADLARRVGGLVNLKLLVETAEDLASGKINSDEHAQRVCKIILYGN